jgi:hypothetical protein
MTDGAHLGLTAEASLDAVLGNARPKENSGMNPVEMRDYLMSQNQPDGYSGTAAYCARLLLEAFLTEPTLARLPGDDVWDHSDGFENRKLVTKGLWSTLKERGSEIAELDLTGFMWGWAVNAARFCVELEPVANPAIITVT